MALYTKRSINLNSGNTGINGNTLPADITSPTNYTKTSNFIQGHLDGIGTTFNTLLGKLDTQNISNKTFIDSLRLQEIASPLVPLISNQKLYPKIDGKLYALPNNGKELKVGLNTHDEIAIAHFNPVTTDWKILKNDFPASRRSIVDDANVAGDEMGFGYQGSLMTQTDNAISGRFGVLKLTGATSAGNYVGMRTNGGHTLKGGNYPLRYGCAIQIDAIPDASNNTSYLLQLGNSVNTFSTTYIQIGAAFSDHATNFTCKVRTGGTITTTDTGVAMDTNWHSFEIHTNADWTEVKFYIDGVLVHTQSVNIPSTADFQYSISTRTNATTVLPPVWKIDWAYIAWKPTTERDSVIYLD